MKTELTSKLKKSEYIGIALFIGLFNSASIFHKFGWGDDWAFLNEYKNGISKVNYEHYSGYRPILQKIMEKSYILPTLKLRKENGAEYLRKM